MTVRANPTTKTHPRGRGSQQLDDIHARFLAARASEPFPLLEKGTELTIGRHPVRVLLELGSGGEGSVLLVQDRQGNKYGLKSFRPSAFMIQLVKDELAEFSSKGYRTLKVVDSQAEVRVPPSKISHAFILFEYVRGIPASAFTRSHPMFDLPEAVKREPRRLAAQHAEMIDEVGPDNVLYDLDQKNFVIIDIG
jgi:hypothetical protein